MLTSLSSICAAAMFQFSTEVERILRQNGWTPERKVDASAILTRLEGLGYNISTHARDIYESFYGLTILGPEQSWLEVTVGLSRVPIHADYIKPVADLFEVDLCPFGYSGADLYISSKGCIVGDARSHVTLSRSRSLNEDLESMFHVRESWYEIVRVDESRKRVVSRTIADWA